MCSGVAVGEAGTGRELYAMAQCTERRPAIRVRGPWARRSCRLNQPDGVPPLPLTGERTLPDVPDENYWYRRHLAVYEWIAARVAGLRVVDMACGEGYGSDLLAAAAAASVVGVDANPEAHEHARLRYVRPNLRFRARPGRDASPSPATPSSSCRRSSTCRTPGAMLEHFKSMLAPGGVAYVSTPNLLTLAPPGAEKSDNPWHVTEYRAAEFRELCEAHFGRVELLGLFHARKLRVHELRAAGWAGTPSTSGSGLTKPFYDRFTPAIAAVRLPRSGTGDLDARARLPRRLPCLSRRAGDLAIVLHSPHALCGGLRHLPVRGGVAVRRGDPLLPAGARGCRAI